MKQLFKSGIGFVLVFMILYPLFIYLWGTYATRDYKHNLHYRIGTYGHMLTRIRALPTFDNLDILFLGSSHAYRGFDTRLFEQAGFHCFNLGSSSQTLIQSRLLLSRYISKLNPKYVVLEVNPEAMAADGVESALDVIANDKNDWGSIKMALQLNHIKIYNTLIYGFIRDMLRLNNDVVETANKNEDTYIKGGFVQKKLAYYHLNHNRKPIQWSVNKAQLDALVDIKNLIKQKTTSKNTQLILVQTPITKSLYSSYIAPNQFDQLMSSYADYTNYNFNDYLIDSLHFFDADHLNQKGVELFNQKLITHLQNK